MPHRTEGVSEAHYHLKAYTLKWHAENRAVFDRYNECLLTILMKIYNKSIFQSFMALYDPFNQKIQIIPKNLIPDFLIPDLLLNLYIT